MYKSYNFFIYFNISTMGLYVLTLCFLSFPSHLSSSYNLSLIFV